MLADGHKARGTRALPLRWQHQSSHAAWKFKGAFWIPLGLSENFELVNTIEVPKIPRPNLNHSQKCYLSGNMVKFWPKIC